MPVWEPIAAHLHCLIGRKAVIATSQQHREFNIEIKEGGKLDDCTWQVHASSKRPKGCAPFRRRTIKQIPNMCITSSMQMHRPQKILMSREIVMNLNISQCRGIEGELYIVRLGSEKHSLSCVKNL